MDTLFFRILNMSITAGWLIIVVIVLRFFLRKVPKWISCMLWVMVGIRLLFPLYIESPVSLIPSPEPINQNIIMSSQPEVHTGIPPLNSVVNPIIMDTFAPNPADSVNPLQIWMHIAAIIWVIGIAVMFIYITISYLNLKNRVRASLTIQDNIRMCDNIESPFVLGVIKPLIYLPSGISEEHMTHIIAHEQAHIKRLDHWWKPLAFVLLAVYWFNPLCWIAYILLCRDIELACDEKVVRGFNKADFVSYSETLLYCSIGRRSVLMCPLAFGEVGVKERVKCILNYKKPSFWIIIGAIVVCIIVGVCFLTNPISSHDYICTMDVNTSLNIFAQFDTRLGIENGSGSIVAEQWSNGECVKSAPVVMSQKVENINVFINPRRENDIITGFDIQIDTDQYGGSLLSYFTLPDGNYAQGWSFATFEKNKKIPLASGDSKIIATLAVDVGKGVSSFDCDSMSNDKERLEKYDYIIVIRASFSDEQITAYRDDSLQPKEILGLDDVIRLSKKGEELTWSDFEQYESADIGSGLYILRYEIDNLFYLLVGGVPDKKPMYIYLNVNNENQDRIDIRTADVQKFIEAHRNDTAVSPISSVNK